jgi:exopolyphosphatase / guanosine-5'-triphosphate,3'-diphosphate pyrophosphatase
MDSIIPTGPISASLRVPSGESLFQPASRIGDSSPTPDSSRKSAPVAAVDIGSNSVRLVINDGTADLVRKATVTRLGRSMSGSSGTGELSLAALEETFACFALYAEDLRAYGVEHCEVFATAAARNAANVNVLADGAARILGHPLQILSGIEEAALAWAGATSWAQPRLTPFGEPAYDLVIDIGGASTEFIVGRPGLAPEAMYSLDVGCVSITDEFLHADPPGPVALSSAVGVVRSHLDDVAREIPVIAEADRLIGIAGSVTTVAAIEIGLKTWDPARVHQFALSRSAAEDVFRTVATESAADRAANPGLAPDRVGTIVGGALIVVAIMRHFEFDSLTVSTTDNLDAVVARLHRI